MNRLKLFISVGICGVLFSGCWFFTTNEQESAKQKTCDEVLPDELCLRLDEYIQEMSSFDSAYIKARNFKERWKLEWQYGQSSLLKEAWEYAKNYDYNVVVGRETIENKYGSAYFDKYGTKKCLELDFGNAELCLDRFSTRYKRLELERQ